MKKLLFTIAICSLSIAAVHSQNPTFQWAKNMGGTGYDEANGVVTDAAGNVYTTGLFNGISDFDPSVGTFTLASAGQADIFVTKLDPTGNLIWAKSFGGTNADYGSAITLDPSGNILLTGYFYGTADFDPSTSTFTLGANGSSDIYISKLDNNGNLLWAKSIGANQSDMATEIKTSSNGDVFVTGTFQETVDFDPSPSTFTLVSSGYDDAFILKLDGSGSFVSAVNIGGTTYDNSNDLHIDQNDNVFITGGFKGTVDFDPGAGVYTMTTTTNGGIYVLKLTPSLTFSMASSLSSTATATPYGIVTDNNGDIIITGVFVGTFDFDPSLNVSNLTSSGSSDIFVLKLTNSGTFIFSQKIGGTSNDTGLDITTDSFNCLYLTGYFAGTTDFDPSPSTYTITTSGQTAFVSKLSSAGTFMWAQKIGSTNTLGKAITVDASGIVSTAGIFHGTGEFDPVGGSFLMTSGGSGDIFVHSMLSSLITSVNNSTIEELLIYPNPASDKINFKVNRIDRITIVNSLGKIMHETIVTPNKNEIDITFLTSGVYFIISQNTKNKIIIN